MDIDELPISGKIQAKLDALNQQVIQKGLFSWYWRSDKKVPAFFCFQKVCFGVRAGILQFGLPLSPQGLSQGLGHNKMLIKWPWKRMSDLQSLPSCLPKAVLSGPVVSRQPRPSNVPILSHQKARAPVTPGQVCRAVSRTYNALETTTTHLSSLFITLTFPFSFREQLAWMQLPFSKLTGIFSISYHLPRYCRDNDRQSKPCGSLGT